MTPDTLLHRQVHPSWVREGRVTSQAFRPTPKDNNRLSVYDGDRVTPEGAWNHYTSVLNYQSSGVVAISVAECENEQLVVVPDPQNAFVEHVLIDFTQLSASRIRRVAGRLARYANTREWMFRASAV